MGGSLLQVLALTGALQSAAAPDPPKRAWLAGALSATLPGAGQVYNGQILKGLLAFGAATAGMTVVVANFHAGYCEAGATDCPGGTSDAVLLGGLALGTAAYVWSIVDAVVSANRINRRSRERSLRMEVRATGRPAGVAAGVRWFP